MFFRINLKLSSVLALALTTSLGLVGPALLGQSPIQVTADGDSGATSIN